MKRTCLLLVKSKLSENDSGTLRAVRLCTAKLAIIELDAYGKFCPPKRPENTEEARLWNRDVIYVKATW